MIGYIINMDARPGIFHALSFYIFVLNQVSQIKIKRNEYVRA